MTLLMMNEYESGLIVDESGLMNEYEEAERMEGMHHEAEVTHSVRGTTDAEKKEEYTERVYTIGTSGTVVYLIVT